MNKSGGYIRYGRLTRGLTQKKLGKELKMNSQFISNIERGECLLPPALIKRVAKFLRINETHLTQDILDEKIKKFYKEIG